MSLFIVYPNLFSSRLRAPYLSADPCVEFAMLPLQLQTEGLQLHEYVTDREAPRQGGHAPQSLEAQLPGEQAAPLQPRTDVLPAQGLGLGHHLKRGVQRGGDVK